MVDISVRHVLFPSGAVLAGTALLALAMTRAAGIDAGDLLPAYLSAAASVVLTALLCWMALSLAVMTGMTGRARPGGSPIRLLLARLPRRAGLITLPALVQPLFFTAFTAAKTAIEPLAHFTWDRAFADADLAIFGIDPWRITHMLIGPMGARALEFSYTMLWGLALMAVPAFLALYASRRFAGTFFFAFYLTWLTGGILMALAMPAAGPIFVHLFDPSLADHFAPLGRLLQTQLAADGPILSSQAYLAGMRGTALAEAGGGISAMPSMHMAMAMLYLCAARGTAWRWPAMLFAVLTAIGSVHFGYHYAVDSLASMALAWGCWQVAARWFARGRAIAGQAAAAEALSAPLAEGGGMKIG